MYIGCDIRLPSVPGTIFFLVDAPSFGPAATAPDGPAPTALYVLYSCTSTYMCNLRVSYLNSEPYQFILL